MSAKQLLAVFRDEVTVFTAVRGLRSHGFSIREIYAPYAVHGLDRAAGMPRSRVGFITVAAAFIGSTLFYFFQDWVSAVNWPLNIGGKPFSSAPAWIPVVFEVGVLSAGLTTVVAMFVRSRLYPGKRAVLVHPRVTDDRFAILLDISDAGFDLGSARRICRESGAESVDEIDTVEPLPPPRKPEIQASEVWQ